MIRFTINKAALEQEFTFLSPALPTLTYTDGKLSPGPMTWLTLIVEGDDVTFVARNAQRLLRSTMKATNVQGAGTFQISPRIIGALIKTLPDEDILFEFVDDRLALAWSTGKCVLPQVVNVPPTETTFTDNARRIILPAAVLSDVLSRAACAYPDSFDSRFSGVLFYSTGEQLRVVACEGAIIALIERQAKAAPLDFTLTTLTCEAIPPLFKGNPSNDVLIELENAVRITCGHRTLLSSQAATKAIPWERLFESLRKTLRADFPAKLALGAIDRAVDHIAKLDLRRGELTVSDEEGGAKDAIGLDYDGDDVAFLFKKRFIKGALRAIGADRVEMIGAPNQPVLFRALGGGGSEQVIVMPIRELAK